MILDICNHPKNGHLITIDDLKFKKIAGDAYDQSNYDQYHGDDTNTITYTYWKLCKMSSLYFIIGHARLRYPMMDYPYDIKIYFNSLSYYKSICQTPVLLYSIATPMKEFEITNSNNNSIFFSKFIETTDENISGLVFGTNSALNLDHPGYSETLSESIHFLLITEYPD